jgi:hypothetical protein
MPSWGAKEFFVVVVLWPSDVECKVLAPSAESTNWVQILSLVWAHIWSR